MKSSAFIIFITIVIVIYSLANFYIFIRGLHAIPQGTSGRTWYIWTFWILASCFVLSRFLERMYPCYVVDVMIWIGSFWLAVMLYSFLFTVAVDLSRLILWITHLKPFGGMDPQRVRLIVFYTGIIAVFLTVFTGFINARIRRHTQLDLAIHKHVEGSRTLKIAMASDIHLGTIIGSRGTDLLVNRLNAMNPDIILLAGDVVDEDLQPVIRQNLGERLKELKAPLGVWAITGNHEYIGGAEPAIKYLEAHGVRFLRDTNLLIDNRFFLAGREDRDKPRFTGKPRKTIDAVMEGVDRNYPVILMDHQPFNFEKTVEQGVDLSLSGHTHHGQMWPLNYITNAIYEKSWGYLKKGETHFYVSSGFGSWGPPVRLGNYPEVIEINLRFE